MRSTCLRLVVTPDERRTRVRRLSSELGDQTGRRRGRPSSYVPELCELVVRFAMTGRSLTAFAGEIRIARSRLYGWAAEHPDFKDALEVAKAVRVNVLETQLLEATSAAAVSARLGALKNLAPDDWADRKAAPAGGIEIPVRISREIDPESACQYMLGARP